MSDLLSLLSLGSSGIAAQNTGVGIATNNVANVNTRGYSRQRADLEALAGAPLVGGVRSGSPDRVASDLLAGRIRATGGSFAMAKALSDALSDVESRLTGSGPTIDEQLAALFSRLSQASATPVDPSMRDAVVVAANDLVAGIRRSATATAASQQAADSRIRDNASRATSLANQLAKANEGVARTNDPVLRDKRDDLAAQLSELVGGRARIDGDGQMRFVLDGGAVLVDGTHAASLVATPNPTTGLANLEVVAGGIRRDVTAAIAGGTIGGDLRARDQTLGRIAGQLDQLAFDLATGFNAVHSANAGLDGVSGRPMFTPLAGVAGAASTIELDPALAADSKLLATAQPGTGPGDNRGALALFDLGTALVASGGSRTVADAALDIISALALEGADATSDFTRGGLVADHLAGLRDSLAGVDIAEELTNLARFEHASSALTKFITTIDDMLGSLIERL